MSTAAERLRAKNQSIKGAQQEGNPASTSTTSVRTTPVRVTVDLAPTTHSALKRWAAEAAEASGQPGVSNQAVLRALVEQLLADPELASTIHQQISNH